MTDTQASDSSAALAPSLRIIAGSPSTDELAAVTAVLARALEEAAAGHEHRAPIRSAWERSRAGLRAPMHPGQGVWRSFSG